MSFLSFVPAILNGITGAYKSRQERKTVEKTAKAKLEIAKDKSSTKVTLTDAEWETIAASKQDSTWKDEYVTLVITAPVVGLMIGGLQTAFTDKTAITDGFIIGLDSLKEVGFDLGILMMPVVLAAVGLKAWRGMK